MTRRPNHNPVQSSPHNTRNRYLEFIRPAVEARGWPRRHLILAGIVALGLAGCTASPAPPGAESAAFSGRQSDRQSAAAVQEFFASPNPSNALETALRQTQVNARRLIVPEDAITVALYRPDDQCADFVVEDALVSRQNDLAETIELILLGANIAAFDLSGYRLTRNPDTKTVTIDLRVSRTSPRLLQSLSFCEQQTLLGSVKATLLNHPEWDIEQVEFTNRGNPLVM